jgi:hypothetical protein
MFKERKLSVFPSVNFASVGHSEYFSFASCYGTDEKWCAPMFLDGFAGFQNGQGR